MKNCTVLSKITKELYCIKKLIEDLYNGSVLQEKNVDSANNAYQSLKKKTKSIWISRSVAVATFTFGYDEDGELYVLVSQRGKGTPDKDLIGAWNCQCGYLDYDEDTLTAAKRETFEETGVELDKANVMFWKFIDDPAKDERQNIVFRYLALFENDVINDISFSTDNMEKDEVSDIQWLNVNEVLKYKWAFDHDSIILDAIETFKLRKNWFQKLTWKLNKSI